MAYSLTAEPGSLSDQPTMFILWGDHLRRWCSPTPELGKKCMLSPDPGEEAFHWGRTLCNCPSPVKEGLTYTPAHLPSAGE